MKTPIEEDNSTANTFYLYSTRYIGEERIQNAERKEKQMDKPISRHRHRQTRLTEATWRMQVSLESLRIVHILRVESEEK